MATNDRLIDAVLAGSGQAPPPDAPADSRLTRNLGAAAALALGILPGARLARAMFATLPRAIGTTGALSGAAALAGPAEAQTAPPPPAAAPPPRDPRQDEIDTLNAQIERAEREIHQLGRRTRDPDRLEVLSRPHQQKLDSATTRRDALRDAIEAERRKADTAAAQLAEEERLRNRTWRERNPDLAANWPWIVPTAAVAAGTLTRGGERLTRALMNVPWHRDVARATRALQTGDPMAAVHMRALANRNASHVPAAVGDSRLPSLVGAGMGLELGLYPMQDDIMNLGFNRAIENPWELAKAGLTAGAGAFSGGTAGKLVGAFIPRSQPPVAASQALEAHLNPALQKAANRRLLDAMQTGGQRGRQPPPVAPPGPAQMPTGPAGRAGSALPPQEGPPALLPPPAPPPSPPTRQPPAARQISPEVQALMAELERLPPEQRLAYLMRRLGLR